MRRIFTLIVLALVLGFASMAYSKTLVDVPSGHWAEDAVQKLIDAGLIEGYPDGTFGGNRPMTRYEYAMVVSRMLDILDKSYCLKSECSAQPPAGGCECDITAEQLAEIKDIVKKLAAEFKDELAALKVKVDENSTRLGQLEKKVDQAFLGKLQVSGSIRQRADVLDTDFITDAGNNQLVDFYNDMYGVALAVPGAATDLTAGYEMVPTLRFNGEAGKNVTFQLELSKYIRNQATIAGTMDDDLQINNAYVDLDFSGDVRELDLLKIRSGYQQVWFGPYGMLVDNSGVVSNAGVRLDIGKDVVSLAAFGGLATVTGSTLDTMDGLGSGGKDVYAAARLALDLPFVDLGFNYLGTGLVQESGWGVDFVAPLLKNTPFLTEMRGEYLTITDDLNGDPAGTDDDDASFVVGLDVYKTKKAGVTVSYADLPAAPTLTGMDASPFTEYDSVCPRGLDFSGVNCYSFESGRMLFPAGFEGLGVQASYIVLGDVELAAKAVIGNYAGGLAPDGVTELDGETYPGYGAFSVTKPINSDSKFRVEYMQQGQDLIRLNRIRGELLISF